MRFLCVILSVIFLLSCSTNNEDDYRIPWAPVKFKVNLNGYDKELETRGSSKSFMQARLKEEYVGFGGLLVVSNLIPDDNMDPTLSAYDLCCPYEAQQNIRVSPTVDGKAKCEKCGSVYDLYSGGNIVSGPTQWRLKWYRVRVQQPYDGTFFIEN